MTRFYFAYGMNMDPVHMAKLCPGMESLDTARLNDHRFAVNRGGLATILPDPDGMVHGVLWRLTKLFEQALDRFEGVDEGLYRREWVQVIPPSGPPCRALVYIATDSQQGVPCVEYLAQIASGARHFGLPAGYLDELAGWSPRV